jgi:hypothetical protein|nr:MAG TPA: N-acetylmuramoyl-L-alanine amidase [Caudoviricetes sp.]
MAFTNSPLVNYKLISPHKSSRNGHVIDTITIHCVAAQAAVETLGKLFQTKEASANYGIGSDGRVGMYVEEKDRSWCSSNGDNDRRAVTIEVASDNKHPYAVNSKAYAKLLDLVTDICKRNGIKKLVWSTNKNDRINHRNGCNMTVHRDYANKACPGDYLYNRHGQIAAEVNKRLGTVSKPAGTTTFKTGDIVKITGTTYYDGAAIPAWIRAKNWRVYQVTGDRVVINKSEDGQNAIMSPVKAGNLALAYPRQSEPVKPTEEPKQEEETEMVRYKTISEMPEWAQKEAQELVDIGALKGNGDATGYDVTLDMLRDQIICLRMCKALIAALPEQTVNKEALFEEFKKNLKLTVAIE